MNPQRRRLNAESDSSSVLNDNAVNLTVITLDDAPAVNIHGLRYCGSIEPENADANANGFWCLYCLPADLIIPATDLPETFAALDNEDFMPYLWGVGCWTASNQAPYHFEFAPMTSRTCQKGARIVGTIVLTGISAGAVRMNSLITGFTST